MGDCSLCKEKYLMNERPMVAGIFFIMTLKNESSSRIDRTEIRDYLEV